MGMLDDVNSQRAERASAEHETMRDRSNSIRVFEEHVTIYAKEFSAAAAEVCLPKDNRLLASWLVFLVTSDDAGGVYGRIRVRRDGHWSWLGKPGYLAGVSVPLSGLRDCFVDRLQRKKAER